MGKTLKERYLKEIRQGFDWEGLVTDCQESEPYETMDGAREQAVFLGTVFNVMPSGKFYMPFACSNVDLCPFCRGAGCKVCGFLGSVEAYRDQEYSAALDDVAEEFGFYVFVGEGDPCDIFVGMSVETDNCETCRHTDCCGECANYEEGRPA